MLNFFRRKSFIEPVQFTNLIKQGADFVVICDNDTYLIHEIIQYCLNWNSMFRKFIFYLPAYSQEFFSRISNFTQVEFKVLNSPVDLKEKSILLNLNTDTRIRKKLKNLSGSLIIDCFNEGNLQFVPEIKDAKELLQKFAAFFDLKLEKKQLQFNFSKQDQIKMGFPLFQNRFLNFILRLNNISQDNLKQIIIFLKQNFPANIYLSGHILKKHEFINLSNLPDMTLLELYLFARNCDIFISDDAAAVKIFQDLQLKQIFMTDDVILNEVASVNIRNLEILKKTVNTILEK
jgi:hypothetical protein